MVLFKQHDSPLEFPGMVKFTLSFSSVLKDESPSTGGSNTTQAMPGWVFTVAHIFTLL